jgi:hypothetical protein
VKGGRRRWVAGFVGIVAVVAVAVVVLNGAHLMDRATGWWVGGRITDAVSRAGKGELLDLTQVYDTDWDRAVWVHPHSDGRYGNELLGLAYYQDDEWLSLDDSESRLIFVKGTDVLADIELGRILFPDDLTGFSREDARFVVTNDGFYSTLNPIAVASR